MFEDSRNQRQAATFSRRAMILFGGQLAIAGVLGGRLYQLQVIENEAYATLSEENRINFQHLAPPRGEIFSRDGVAIAMNRPNYSILLVRERTSSLEATFTRLRRLIDLSDEEIARLERRLKRASAFVPITVKENLSWDQFARLNANAPALPGVLLEEGPVREYPLSEPFAHVVGYVGAVNEDDLARDASNDPILRLPSARIGKNGVEKAAETRLRGSAGRRKIEVNAGGREIRELERDLGEKGEDLTLTIDAGVQLYAMERLKGESASAVLMDVWTGDIIALASSPAYDPNKFVFGISPTDWNALREDEYDPLRNKACAGQYPPGSTFKMMTALAALESGAMRPRDGVSCSGKLFYGDRAFHCWRRSGHGRMRLHTGIKQSCDVYFYEAARRAGIEQIAEIGRKFGLGQAPRLEIPNVRPGIMPTPDWLFAERGLRWSGGDTLNVGIGQGTVLLTPLQLAVMTARLANGSEKVEPRIIRAVNGVELPPGPFEPLGVDPENVGLVRDGMNAVSNEAGGTAFRSQIFDPQQRLAGKTGTAQVRRIGRAERNRGIRRNEDLPWRLRDHALFVAFAPVQAPRYAISVVVEHGGGGSRAAAPVARDIMMRALYGGDPPLEAYPPWIRPEIEAARRAAQDARYDPQRLFGVVEQTREA